MGRSTATDATQRSNRNFPVAKPRWAFWKGLATGAVIEVPAIAATVWVLSRIGIGDPHVELMHVIRLTALFAGIAALLTAGGIGRVAAYATVAGGRRRAMFAAMRAHAIASGGLVLIAAIPHGDLPTRWQGWVAYPVAGLVTGSICGLLIGAMCSGTTAVGLADVWSLAKRPSEALKHLLDPDDFVRLGHSLRDRTSTFFDGIFEPAPPPPSSESTKPATAATMPNAAATVALGEPPPLPPDPAPPAVVPDRPTPHDDA